MTDRISCVVPFCVLTRGDRKGDPIKPGMEWICGDHWRLIEKQPRRVYGRMRKRRRKFSPTQSDIEAEWRLWRWLKRKAIESAMGIAT